MSTQAIVRKSHKDPIGTYTNKVIEFITKWYREFTLNNGIFKSFKEKPKRDGNRINPGFMVCKPQIFDYLSDEDDCIFEQGPMDNIAHDRQMSAYKHYGFWHPMNSVKDKIELTKMWDSGIAPWK